MTQGDDGDDDDGAGAQGRSLAWPGVGPLQVTKWIHGFTQLPSLEEQGSPGFPSGWTRMREPARGASAALSSGLTNVSW